VAVESALLVTLEELTLVTAVVTGVLEVTPLVAVRAVMLVMEATPHNLVLFWALPARVAAVAAIRGGLIPAMVVALGYLAKGPLAPLPILDNQDPVGLE
jgi:hypothetical protein